MTLAYRHAVDSDVPALARLAARTFPLACPPELGRDAIESFVADNLGESSFRGYLGAPGNAVLVGVDGSGDPRAYALLVDGTAMSEDCAEMVRRRPTIGVSKFYVDPDLHGAGVARSLLDSCVALAWSKGAESLWLATNVGNTRARAFYVKNGFAEVGHRVFTVGGVDNDDVVLESPL